MSAGQFSQSSVPIQTPSPQLRMHSPQSSAHISQVSLASRFRCHRRPGRRRSRPRSSCSSQSAHRCRLHTRWSRRCRQVGRAAVLGAVYAVLSPEQTPSRSDDALAAVDGAGAAVLSLVTEVTPALTGDVWVLEVCQSITVVIEAVAELSVFCSLAVELVLNRLASSHSPSTHWVVETPRRPL